MVHELGHWKHPTCPQFCIKDGRPRSVIDPVFWLLKLPSSGNGTKFLKNDFFGHPVYTSFMSVLCLFALDRTGCQVLQFSLRQWAGMWSSTTRPAQDKTLKTLVGGWSRSDNSVWPHPLCWFYTTRRGQNKSLMGGCIMSGLQMIIVYVHVLYFWQLACLVTCYNGSTDITISIFHILFKSR